MAEKTVIYGKPTCPFTKAAIEDYNKRGISFDFVDVKERPDQLDVMLKYSNGIRKIPVIVKDENVTMGFNGRC